MVFIGVRARYPMAAIKCLGWDRAWGSVQRLKTRGQTVCLASLGDSSLVGVIFGVSDLSSLQS